MPAEKPTEKPSPKASPEPAPLGSAAASLDPAVQNLLAHRDIAERNGDKDAVADLTARLAALGVQ